MQTLHMICINASHRCSNHLHACMCGGGAPSASPSCGATPAEALIQLSCANKILLPNSDTADEAVLRLENPKHNTPGSYSVVASTVATDGNVTRLELSNPVLVIWEGKHQGCNDYGHGKHGKHGKHGQSR